MHYTQHMLYDTRVRLIRTNENILAHTKNKNPLLVCGAPQS